MLLSPAVNKDLFYRYSKEQIRLIHTVKPDELVQLKPFEETVCLKSLKTFINSNNLSIKKYLICFQVTQ